MSSPLISHCSCTSIFKFSTELKRLTTSFSSHINQANGLTLREKNTCIYFAYLHGDLMSDTNSLVFYS